MNQHNRRRRVRQASAGVLTAALLAACGGGEIFAILQIVTPLGGQWVLEGSAPADPKTIFFDNAESGDRLFASRIDVNPTLSVLPGVCADNDTLRGTLDNGKLTLFPTAPTSTTACLEGTFTDLRRLELTVPGQTAKWVYLNDRVAVKLEAGLWTSASGTPTLKFSAPSSVSNGLTTPVAGCDVTSSTAKVNFTGTMSGFNTTTLARPVVPALVGTAFTQVEVVDGASLQLRDGSGKTVLLTRQPDPAPGGTTCPL